MIIGLDKAVQTTDDHEVPFKPVSSTPQMTKKTNKSRPKYLKRLHSLHTDIPFVPEARDKATHRYWHFGPSLTVKYATFSSLLNRLTRWDAFQFVLVGPTASAAWPSPFAEQGEKAVTFCMIVSDCSTHYFTRRPTEEQMARLVRVFGWEPSWMMDARPKSRWHEYGHDE
ncbi:hypothetical protein BD626DRAFT_549604 [Schizophyllum amplum]|uniref:Uncharacterized protein n=1 Tax=Schizophyllum amplum TaxID=97359 RepID=A0A550C758_9AGAR|nr:hypothetical protein BD626DRAFT_549604 [Auriculariopsis ampla]